MLYSVCSYSFRVSSSSAKSMLILNSLCVYFFALPLHLAKIKEPQRKFRLLQEVPNSKLTYTIFFYGKENNKLSNSDLVVFFHGIWDMPMSKVGNPIFDVSLFENRKLRILEMSKIAYCGIRNRTIWCFCNHTRNVDLSKFIIRPYIVFNAKNRTSKILNFKFEFFLLNKTQF